MSDFVGCRAGSYVDRATGEYLFSGLAKARRRLLSLGSVPSRGPLPCARCDIADDDRRRGECSCRHPATPDPPAAWVLLLSQAHPTLLPLQHSGASRSKTGLFMARDVAVTKKCLQTDAILLATRSESRPKA